MPPKIWRVACHDGRIPIIKLRKVYCEGYKALDPLRLKIDQQAIFLIGPNGAGKSTTLQALAFVHHFGAGQPYGFFGDRGWVPPEIRSKTVEKPHNTLRYSLAFDAEDGVQIVWSFSWGVQSLSNIQEGLWIKYRDEPIKCLFTYLKQSGLMREGAETIKGLVAHGSIMNVITGPSLTDEPKIVESVLAWAQAVTSLELLSPVAMRLNDRGSSTGIGTKGQRLAGFLASLDSKQRERVIDRASDFYPIEDINITRKRAGWIDMRIKEKFSFGPISLQHVSDGLLRILALCAIPEFSISPSLVLLDEIEDGIEPHILPRIIDRVIKDCNTQFILTSHSPLLVNFFDMESIILVARSSNGTSQLVPMKVLPSVQSGIAYEGVGEIWANTGLRILEGEAVESFKDSEGGRVAFTDDFANSMLA